MERLLAVGLILLTLYAFAAERRGPAFPRIANCYGIQVTPWSDEADLAEAAKWDLMIGGLWCNWADPEQARLLKEKMTRLHELNPDLIILDFSCSAPYAFPEDTTFPQSGWLKQPDGRFLDGWPGTRMINLTRPEVLDWIVAQCARSVRERGYDGVFIDCMGPSFDTWACNIETGEAYEVDANEDGVADERGWLDEAWREAKRQVADRVRAELGPDMPFMDNQGGRDTYGALNGILLEDYLDYVLDGNWGWEGVLEDYLYWTNTPHQPTMTAFVSSSAIEPPFDAWKSLDEAGRNALLERGRVLLPRMRFGLATTLMGDGYFGYDMHTRWRGQRWWYPEYDAPLGWPKGPAEKQPEGTWSREFEGGTVVLNPTPLDVRLTMHGRRLDVSSQQVGREFLIPAQDGRLLLYTREAEREGNLPVLSPTLTAEGPEPILLRGDMALVRLGEAGYQLWKVDGRLARWQVGDEVLVEPLRTQLAANEKWRDFAIENASLRLEGSRTLVMEGQRVLDDFRLAYTKRLTVKENDLTLQCHWKALSAGTIFSWRERLTLPPATWAGGTWQAGGQEGSFSKVLADPPQLAEDFRKVKLTTASGLELEVAFSGEAWLVDERFWNAPGFLLGLQPFTGEVSEGQEWDYTVKFKLR